MVGHEARFEGPPLERKVLRDTVRDQLFRMLVDGSLGPGMNLSIDGLARDLCVSPTPVREALVHLEHTGLVRRAALRGYTVAEPLSTKELHDLVAARRLIEGEALRVALDHLDPTEAEGVEGAGRAGGSPLVEHLSGALDEQRRAFDEVTRHGALCPPAHLYAYLVSEWEFHRVLVAQSGNPYLERMLDFLEAEVHRVRRARDGRPLGAAASIAEHAEIVTAIGSGRHKAAAQALMDHLDGLLRRPAVRSPGEII